MSENCYMCEKDIGTSICPNTEKSICDPCLRINSQDETCAYCDTFKLLKEKIARQEFGGLEPSLSCRDEVYAMEIKNAFVLNNEKRMEQFGSTGWGRRQHYIYRDDDGELYTFCVSGYINDLRDIQCLKQYEIPILPDGAFEGFEGVDVKERK